MVWIHWNDFVICQKPMKNWERKQKCKTILCLHSLEYVSKLIKVDHLFAYVLFSLWTSDGCFAIFKFGVADFQRHSTIFVDFVLSV